MGMYTVLFVDDEPWVIVDILHSIPWEKLGFKVIGHYEKPREAKGVILSQKPHIVFVDINMPVMNGFELIRQCREEGYEGAFIILSAYSDFEFAKQAIKAAVLDYCLKPVNPEAMIKVLEETKIHLDEKEAVRLAEHEAEASPSGVPDGAPSGAPSGDEEYISYSEERFNRVLDYVKSHFNTRLLLSELAEQFSFSKNYICFLFKKYTHTTFSNYITHIKIEKAKQLLEHTDMPLQLIAQETGFMDVYYFGRVFKIASGVPPHRYRIQAKSKNP
jgi:two-component system response regulator YesN